MPGPGARPCTGSPSRLRRAGRWHGPESGPTRASHCQWHGPLPSLPGWQAVQPPGQAGRARGLTEPARLRRSLSLRLAVTSLSGCHGVARGPGPGSSRRTQAPTVTVTRTRGRAASGFNHDAATVTVTLQVQLGRKPESQVHRGPGTEP